MFDPTNITDDAGSVLDICGSLEGAKLYLKQHGFSEGFGSEDTVDKFETFVEKQVDSDGTYAGKSTKWGQGGRNAIFHHKAIVSGDYGESLDDITAEDYLKIKTASRINYLRKMGYIS